MEAMAVCAALLYSLAPICRIFEADGRLRGGYVDIDHAIVGVVLDIAAPAGECAIRQFHQVSLNKSVRYVEVSFFLMLFKSAYELKLMENRLFCGTGNGEETDDGSCLDQCVFDWLRQWGEQISRKHRDMKDSGVGVGFLLALNQLDIDMPFQWQVCFKTLICQKFVNTFFISGQCVNWCP